METKLAVDGNHGVLSLLLGKQRLLSAGGIQCRERRAQLV